MESMKMRKPTVTAGIVSPLRTVPPHIARPEYADTGVPRPYQLSCVKVTNDEIERSRKAGGLARQVLDAVLAEVRPGIATDELDRIAHERIIALGAYPSPLNYMGFPKSICTSVNEVVVHGIPDSRVLVDGDIVNCDVTVFAYGMHGDCSETVFVGEVDAESKKLVRVTWECLMRAIDIVRPGQLINAIGLVIEAHARENGFSVVREFTGHGIGESFHMSPYIAHFYEPDNGARIEQGMTFTIEPMINAGMAECVIWPDKWAAVTADLARSAQFEHTLLVTRNGVEILTGGREPWILRHQGGAGRTGQ
jgi:methionyl aminopeptidase